MYTARENTSNNYELFLQFMQIAVYAESPAFAFQLVTSVFYVEGGANELSVLHLQYDFDNAYS